MTIPLRLARATTATILVALAFCVWPVIPGPHSVRAGAEAWVAAHSDQLPDGLQALNLYPEAFQDAIYASFSPEQKLSVWRQFLNRKAGELATVSGVKAAFLRRFAAALSLEDFTGTSERRLEMGVLVAEGEVVLGAQFDLLRSNAWRRSTLVREPLGGGIGQLIRILPLHLATYLLTPNQVAAVEDCDCWVDEEGQYRLSSAGRLLEVLRA